MNLTRRLSAGSWRSVASRSLLDIRNSCSRSRPERGRRRCGGPAWTPDSKTRSRVWLGCQRSFSSSSAAISISHLKVWRSQPRSSCSYSGRTPTSFSRGLRYPRRCRSSGSVTASTSPLRAWCDQAVCNWLHSGMHSISRSRSWHGPSHLRIPRWGIG